MRLSRHGSRVVAAGAALVTLLSGLLLTAPAADAAPSTSSGRHERYLLALGASYTFGFQRAKFDAEVAANAYDPASFDTGFVDVVAQRLRRERGHRLTVVNLSCPGETSATFVTGGCGFHALAPLHAAYPATQPQLDAALAFLAAHPGRVRVILVSVSELTGNSLRDLYFTRCARDVTCAAAQLPAVVAAEVARADAVLGALRAAAPRARTVALQLFDPFMLSDPQTVPLWQAVNGALAVVAARHGVRLADGVSPVTPANLCTLTFVCTPPLFDFHPTDAGYAVLADAVLAALRHRDEDARAGAA